MYRLFLSRINTMVAASVLLMALTPASFARAETPVAGVYSTPMTEHGYTSSPSLIRGQLKARQFTTLSAGVSAHLTGFNLAVGEEVKKGQTIARFDCRMEAEERNIARAKLDAAREKIRVNERLSELNNVATIDLQMSRAERAIAQAELKRIEAQLDYCVVEAPFNGVVVDKHVQAYQFVNRGEPLLELVNIDVLEIEMVAPSHWLSRLGENARFEFKVDETNAVVYGTLDRTGGIIEPVSQTVKLIGVMTKDQDGARLLPGMSGSVNFTQLQD